MSFTLDAQLVADTVPVEDWPLCRVLLMNDSTYPWLVLVPRREGIVELFDLTDADRATLMGEIARAGAAIDTAFSPDKINVGALGNVVRQLHIHVLGRRTDDPLWPSPVWGAAKPVPYQDGAAETVIEKLRQAWG